MKTVFLKIAVSLAVLQMLLTPGWGQEVQPQPAPAQEQPKPLAPGWLSLDSSVGLVDKKIDEGRSALEKALFGIGISGFLDAGYTYSFNHPGAAFAHNISGRFFDQDHNQIVFNDFNLTLDKPEKDWGVGFHIVGDFGRTAQLLRQATQWRDNFGGPATSAELREAFLTYTIPIGAGLQIKGGKFVTLMGTEILPAPGSYNPNISRSFLFNFAIPFTHTGVLFSYPIAGMLTLMGGPVTGWDDPHDNNNRPSFHGGFTFTPADAFSLTTSIMNGPEQPHENGRDRFTISNVATIKPIPSLSALTTFLEYTYGHEQKATPSLRNATWQGVAAIASYDWTDRFNTALRGEFFSDRDGVRTGGFALGVPTDVGVGEFTLTGAYKFTAKLLGRLEFRQDWANKSVFAEGNSSSKRNQTTLALQAIYAF